MKKRLLTLTTALAVVSSFAFAQIGVTSFDKPSQGEVLPIGNPGAMKTIHSSVLKSSSATLAGTALFQDDFSSNKGWTLGSSWAINAAVSEPAADHTQQGDNGIMACPLGVDYSNNMVRSDVVSPVIDCTGKTAVILSFWSFSGCETSQNDHMGVEVYNGTSWVTVWSNPDISFQESSWVKYKFDVSSSAANNPNFQVRFYMGTTDGNYENFSGWAIDDLWVYEPIEHDLAVVTIAPGYVKSGSTIAPVVTVVNYGDYNESAYNVTLTDNLNYTEQVSVTTSVGQSTDVIFPNWTPADGTPTLTAVVPVANDADASNNTLSRECLVRVPRLAYTSTYISGITAIGQLMVPSDEYLPIGNTSLQVQGMAWKDGVLYGVAFNGIFGTLNINNGLFSPIGSTELNVNYYTSLVCDPTTGVLYMTTLTGGYPLFTIGLYTVNPQTGAASLVANSSHNGTIAQAAFDESGNLYCIEHIPSLNGKFYAMNKSTAEMTLIGDLGGIVSANFQPMVWDDHEDVMYFQASKGSGGNMQGTYVIDVATGAATLIGTPYSSQILAMTIPDFDANLSDLAVDAVTVAGFSPDIYTYNVLLPSGTTVVPQVTYQAAYPNADVQLTDATALPGTTTVVVTAPDATTRTYTIHFTVSATTNVALADLKVSGKTIAGFSPATLVYNYVLPSGTTVVPVITATTADGNATAVVTAAASLPGATTVVVTAQDGVSKQTYTVNFLVLANDVATLSDIRVNGISIVNFDAVTSTYNVELPYGISFVPKVRATATDANATMTVTNATALPGVATVVVKAANTTTTLTYTINLTVAAPSADASLSDLKVGGVSLSDFSSSDYDYNVILPQGTSIVPLLTAVSTEGHANVVVTNAAVLTGASSVLVTAQDGTTQLTYTVNFSVSTGIDETSDLAMTIYQIPSEEKVVVQMGTIIQSVSVLNINGLKIQQSKFNSNEAVIRTFGMNSGIYVLQIVTAEGVVTSKIQISK